MSIFTGTARDEPIFGSLVESTIKEVGNIIGCTYLTALTELTGITRIASVPTLSRGTAENAFLALMDVPDDQEVVYVQTGFEKEQPVIAGRIHPDPRDGVDRSAENQRRQVSISPRCRIGLRADRRSTPRGATRGNEQIGRFARRAYLLQGMDPSPSGLRPAERRI